LRTTFSKKTLRTRKWVILGGIVSLCGIVLFSRLADSLFFKLVSLIIQRKPKSSWPGYLHGVGIGLFLLGGLIILTHLYIFPRLSKIFKKIAEKINRLEDRIETGLSPYVRFENPSETSFKSKTVNWVDILLGILFLAIALFLFLSRIQGDYPHIITGGDGGNILSFAAALDHPEYFKGDALLNNLDNFSIYATLNIPLIRWLNRYTGDYGLAFTSLIIPQIFIQLVGFYILGRVLLKNRWWAFLFTLMISMPFDINLEETWGINLEAISRFNFQALIPYLIALAILWRNRPQRWPWIMIFAGLLVFVHPVSTPAWGLALWMGFIPFLPTAWTKWKRAAVMLGLGALFLVAASPFILNYMTHHIQGKSADYKLVYSIIINHFPQNLLNVPAAMLDFLTITFKSGILPGAIVGCFIVWMLQRHDRSNLKLFLFWTFGILLMSVLLPWIEQSIERWYRIIPIETELVRGIRYFVFFMLIFCLWPLAELSKRLKPSIASRTAIACGIIITGLWMMFYHPNLQVLGKTIDCFSRGSLVCVSSNDESALIDAIRTKTPQDARFFASFANSTKMSFALPIRTSALRSLVYTFKDRGMMVYSNNEELTTWDKTYRLIEYTRNGFITDYAAQFPRYLNIAINLGADYFVINFPPPPGVLQNYSLELVYQNPTYTLYRIKPGN
jgi:hypothetical protein